MSGVPRILSAGLYHFAFFLSFFLSFIFLSFLLFSFFLSFFLVLPFLACLIFFLNIAIRNTFVYLLAICLTVLSNTKKQKKKKKKKQMK